MKQLIFIWQVYSILLCQLVVTIAFICFFLYWQVDALLWFVLNTSSFGSHHRYSLFTVTLQENGEICFPQTLNVPSCSAWGILRSSKGCHNVLKQPWLYCWSRQLVLPFTQQSSHPRSQSRCMVIFSCSQLLFTTLGSETKLTISFGASYSLTLFNWRRTYMCHMMYLVAEQHITV